MIYAILVLTLLALNCGAIWCSGYVIRLFMYLHAQDLPRFDTIFIAASLTYSVLGIALFVGNKKFFSLKISKFILIFLGVSLLIVLLPPFYFSTRNIIWEVGYTPGAFLYVLANVPLLFIVTPIVFGLLSAATSE